VPEIYDNKKQPLGQALRKTLHEAVTFDACVGYLNLRGWGQLADAVDDLEGKGARPPARVLVGMASKPDQVVREAYKVRRADDDERVTLKDTIRLREGVLEDFRAQLTVGAPSDAQEATLRQFRTQLENGVVRVKSMRAIHSTQSSTWPNSRVASWSLTWGSWDRATSPSAAWRVRES
jgi:hypothetical protein